LAERPPQQAYRDEGDHYERLGGYKDKYGDKGGKYREGEAKRGKYGGDKRDGKPKYRKDNDRHVDYTE
jgi:hypothetical protein